MAHKNWFDEQFSQFDDDPEYKAGLLRLGLYEDILRIMEEQGISRAELAKRLSCSKAYVSKLFNDSANITIHSLVRIALSLGCDVEVSLVPRAASHDEAYEKQEPNNNWLRYFNGKDLDYPYPSAA